MALTVSRADIALDKIVNRTDIDRFIKIPIDNYLGLLGVIPITSQIAIINAINDPKYRFLCAAISRRQGKTYIANIIGQMISLVPNSSILIMSPNYSLSQISFELQRQLIKHFELEVERDNAKDKVIELCNASTIRMGSVNQVDSVVGRSYDLIIFDEAALSDNGEEAFNVALKPTLDKSNAKAIFISTPRGKNNWFSKFYDRGFSEEFPSWVSIHSTYHENPRVSLEDIEESKRTMSEAEFRQEYLADFNTFEGQIYNFDNEVCEIGEDFEIPKGCDVIAGIDVGFRDPTSAIIVLYHMASDTYYIVDEYEDKEKTTKAQAEDIKALFDKWNVDYAFIDSAAQQTRYDFAMEYDISTNNAKKSVTDGIGYVASLIDNNKLLVRSNCKKVLVMLDQYQWDPNPKLLKEKPKHDAQVHLADALRYAVYSFAESAAMGR